MKHIAAAIYTNFTTYIVDDEGMEHQTDGYSSRPATDRLILRFEPARPQPLVKIHQKLNIPPMEL
jgi:hypothetical protein